MEWEGAEGRGIREWEWAVQKVRVVARERRLCCFLFLSKTISQMTVTTRKERMFDDDQECKEAGEIHPFADFRVAVL